MIVDFTVNRNQERDLLLRNTVQGHHTLLIGRSGVGKTHLLIDLKRRLRDHDPNSAPAPEARPTHEARSAPESPPATCDIHFIARPVPARETIESVYAWLAMLAGVSLPHKVTQGTRIADLSSFIAEILASPRLAGKKIVLLLDDFDRLPVLAVSVFEMLAERMTLVAATRRRRLGARFNRLMWRFEELNVDLLSPAETRELTVRALTGITSVKTINERTREFLVTRIATLSNGVPSAVIESIERLRGAERIDEHFIRELFVHRSADTFFDATPLILSFFAFLVVMRYINRGMYQFDLYAIFGALSGLMLLARWFMMRTSRSET